MNEDEFEYPINGVLDLHIFNPRDLGSLIDEYIFACLEKEIYELRIVHGKGTGQLRRSVHVLLDRNPHVVTYGQAGESGGGWGATSVTIKKL